VTRLNERLDHEMTAEFVHDDHGRQCPAAEAADVFAERCREQTEFGEGRPLLAAKTLLARDDLAAGVEVVLVAQQPLHGGPQQFLLFRELDIHPILSCRRC